MLLQTVDADPEHLVVAQRPSPETNAARDGIAATIDDGIDAAIYLCFGLRVIGMRRFWADDVDEGHPLRLHRPRHHVGGLLLAVVLAAVGYGGTVEKVNGVVGAIINGP